jgi:hypothetical protein
MKIKTESKCCCASNQLSSDKLLKQKRDLFLSDNSGSHGSEYEVDSLLGYFAV